MRSRCARPGWPQRRSRRVRRAANVRAIDAVRLAVGVATWTTAGERFTAPVPAASLGIRRHHTTFELKLARGLLRQSRARPSAARSSTGSSSTGATRRARALRRSLQAAARHRPPQNGDARHRHVQRASAADCVDLRRRGPCDGQRPVGARSSRRRRALGARRRTAVSARRPRRAGDPAPRRALAGLRQPPARRRR